MDLAAKRRAARAAPATKVASAENGELTPAKDPDLGTPNMGIAVPPELEKVVEQAKNEDPQEDLGIVIPPALSDVVEASSIAVCDPEVLAEDGNGADLDMVPLFPEDASSTDELLAANARWIVFANGKPLAEIALNDQEHKAKVAAHFVSGSFANSVMASFGKKGLKAALAEVHAHYYVAKLDETRKVQQITASLTAKAEEASRQKLASIKATYTKSLDMALQAAANNFTVVNALKDDLVKRLVSAGIPGDVAGEMVDDSFFAKGAETISTILDTAENFTNMPVEAFAHVKASVEAAGRRSRPMAQMTSPAARNPNYNAQLAAQYAGNAVPVMSASVNTMAPITAAVEDDAPLTGKDAYRAKFGKFGRR